MLKDDVGLLRLLSSDQSRQDGLHAPGRYWQGITKRTRRAIERDGLSSFRSNAAISKGYADVIVTDPFDASAEGGMKGAGTRRFVRSPAVRRLVRPYVLLNEQRVSEMLRWKSAALSTSVGDAVGDVLRDVETTRGDPREVITIRGERYGGAYVRHAVQLINVAQTVPFGRTSGFFEVGGGFGALTHLVLERFENVRKVLYVDIAPTLYVGTQYLRSFFGEAVVDYRQTRDRSTIRFADDERREVICIPPWQMGRVDAELDVFWNAASFSEMDGAQVRFYGANVNRLLRRSGHLCLFTVPSERPTGWRTSTRADVEDALHPFRLTPVVGGLATVEGEIGEVGTIPGGFVSS